MFGLLGKLFLKLIGGSRNERIVRGRLADICERRGQVAAARQALENLAAHWRPQSKEREPVTHYWWARLLGDDDPGAAIRRRLARLEEVTAEEREGG